MRRLSVGLISLVLCLAPVWAQDGADGVLLRRSQALECLRLYVLDSLSVPEPLVFSRDSAWTVEEEALARLGEVEEAQAVSDALAFMFRDDAGMAPALEKLGGMLDAHRLYWQSRALLLDGSETPGGESWMMQYALGGLKTFARFLYDGSGVLVAYARGLEGDWNVVEAPLAYVEAPVLHPEGIVPVEGKEVRGVEEKKVDVEEGSSGVSVVESLVDASRADAPLPRHAEFRGIPIDGALESFGRKLVDKGYAYGGKGQDLMVFRGPFSGVADCAVEVSAAGGKVWKVTVILPAEKFWSRAKARYLDLKESFRQKYGQEYECREKLSKSFPEGSNQEVWGFENGSSVYESYFAVPMGSVSLSVLYDSKTSGMCVVLDYVDRANLAHKHEVELGDL